MSDHDDLTTAVYEALGAASMCWEHPPTGVFDSDRAKALGDALIAAITDEIARVRADEARRHHQVEVQGGTWRICCAVCKTHVRPHFMCVLDSRYDGPLPEGHSYEGTTT